MTIESVVTLTPLGNAGEGPTKAGKMLPKSGNIFPETCPSAQP